MTDESMEDRLRRMEEAPEVERLTKLNDALTEKIEMLTKENAQLESSLHKLIEVRIDQAESAFVLASKRNIYVLLTSMEKAVLVAQREDDITALCVHDGELYNATRRGIRRTLSGNLVSDKVREGMVAALCSYGGRLYCAAKGLWKKSAVVDVFSGEIISRKDTVTSLCTHERRLIGGGTGAWNGYVFDAFNGKIIQKNSCAVTSVSSVVNPVSLYTDLYYATQYGIYRLGTDDMIIEKGPVTDLFSHNGKLHDVSGGYLSETAGRIIVESPPIQKARCVDLSIAKELLHRSVKTKENAR